ncbi:MAG: hypothetical protein KF866_07990 [Phycisphaeraceae bacterium]|nr:hypothetical protein [Phycisphaeraceae bacterium]MCW5753816.1 hypothetical protein [Phycisphaeraceae bacterium]
MTTRSTPPNGPSRRMLAPAGRRLVAVVAGLTIASFSALADVTTVPARYVVVLANDVPLRCGDLDRFYRVGHLRQGTVLRVDGEGAGWLRVEYPAGSSAFVPLSEAAATADGKSVRLTSPSRLRAANVVGGLSKSWKSLLDEPLPAGTELRLMEHVKDDSGTLVGYRVATPRPARAYLHSQFVRAATQAEAQTYVSTPAGSDILATPEPVRRTSETPEPQPGSNNVPGTTPPASSGDQTPAVDTSLLTPEPVRPVERPASDPIADQPSTPPAATIDQATGEGIAQAPAARDVRLTLVELERAYQALIQQPPETAEFEELHEQFRHALGDLEPGPLNDNLRRRVEARIQWIEFRIQTRDDVRRVTERSDEGKAQIEAMRRRIEQAEAAGGYTIVGRLASSAIYDGARLPLLLALRSVEGQPRTLAYIRITDANRHILTHLGQVVGVVGDLRQAPDYPTLREVVVRRIDTITQPTPSDR